MRGGERQMRRCVAVSIAVVNILKWRERVWPANRSRGRHPRKRKRNDIRRLSSKGGAAVTGAARNNKET